MIASTERHRNEGTVTSGTRQISSGIVHMIHSFHNTVNYADMTVDMTIFFSL